MRHHNAIRIPKFLEKPPPAAYSSVGLAARAVYLQNIAKAWQQAGDDSTAAKMQRDAEDAAKRSVLPEESLPNEGLPSASETRPVA